MIFTNRSSALGRASLFFVAALLLAAVAGAAEMGPRNDYWPLAVGDRWTYDVQMNFTHTMTVGDEPPSTMKTQLDATGKVAISKTDSKTFKPDTVFVGETQLKGTAKMTFDSTTEKQEMDQKAEEYCQQGENGILVRGEKTDDNELDRYDPPEIELPTPVKVGSKWETNDYDLLYQVGTPIPVKAEVTGTATVKVDAGEFKDCLVVEIEPRQKEFTEKGGTKVVISDWESKQYFAKGVGKVKAKYSYSAKMTSPKQGDMPAMTMTIKATETDQLKNYEVR